MTDDKALVGDKQPEDFQGETAERAPLGLEDESAEAFARVRGAPASDADDDDETWTNRPPAEQEEGAESSVGEDADDEEDEQEVESVKRSSRQINSARDVVLEELPERALRAATRLKPFLTGVTVIEFTNTGERFVFDWRDDGPKMAPLSRDVVLSWDEHTGPVVQSDRVNADAVVFLTEQHLMSIRAGDLNPQIGMLTEKIKVQGRVSSAVYLFNLVAPRARP
jgi:hypothetical protein